MKQKELILSPLSTIRKEYVMSSIFHIIGMILPVVFFPKYSIVRYIAILEILIQIVILIHYYLKQPINIQFYKKMISFVFSPIQLISATIFLYFINKEYLYFIILLFTLVTLFYNSFRLKSRFLLFFLSIISGTALIIALNINKSPIMIFINIYIYINMLLIVYIQWTFINDVTQQITGQSLDIQRLQEKTRSQWLSNIIAEHDLCNHLTSLHFLTGEIKSKKMQIQFMDIFKKMEGSLELLKLKKSRFNMYYIASKSSKLPEKNIDIIINKNMNKYITYDLQLFVSLITNTINNSAEAAQRKKISKPTISFSIQKEKLIIKDNCGGFDTSKIETGYSEKNTEGHGIFLASLLNNPEAFECKPSISSNKKGTVISLSFNKNLFKKH
jgi:hypothetical protein